MNAEVGMWKAEEEFGSGNAECGMEKNGEGGIIEIRS